MQRVPAFVPFALAMAAVTGLAPATPALAQDYAIIGLSLFDDLVPGGGAEGADADFNAEFDFVEGQVCYYLEINGLPDADGAAIHRGREDGTGAEMVALPLPDPPDDEVCLAVDASLLRRMSDRREDYYVMVRTPDFPEGAIRAQLSH
ncbi:CHRD domain-containing protein [Aurantiacibacter gilvus]|uniref:CHRD domain-containing protein n=1 Tax=Aurantiacibacter gilvus TaxID=3139141 RepID=A0ABU9IE09_9SPHN